MRGSFRCPGWTASLENQAERTLERPEVGGTIRRCRISRNLFNLAMGGHGPDFLVDGGSDTAINMVVNGATVATTTVETPTPIKIATPESNCACSASRKQRDSLVAP